jgi:pimeloyl-ACP methyl ester carboxylesterase
VAVETLGRGEPLVLLHGLGTTQQIWSLVTSGLARDHRVITLDLPGFGASAPADPGFDLESVAERVARGLTGHGVRAPFDLLGHSLGGAVALTLAVRRPRLIRRLVLAAPAGLRPLPQIVARALGAGADGLYTARRRLAPLTDLPWGRRLLLALTADDPARLTPAQARMMVLASAQAQRVAPALTAAAHCDLRPWLTQTPAPIGVLWGQHDRTIPRRLAGEILSARPDAVLEEIARSGHVPMVERPDEFVEAVFRVLGRLDKHATISSGPPRSVR